MLKPVPSLHALRILRGQILESPFRCRSCETPISSGIRRVGLQFRWKRQSSHVAPVSAVDTQRPVPNEYTELHGALRALGASSSTYVDRPRLQLALQGLESRSTILRIGGRARASLSSLLQRLTSPITVQGIHSRSECIGLVRTLLADPLEPEQSWENLLSLNAEDQRALYIRYFRNISGRDTI
jgi:hypothetical protein